MNTLFKYFLSFFLLITSVYSFAQKSKIDSLLTLLKKDREDTAKITHLNAIGFLLMYSNPDTSVILSNQALQLANSLPFDKGKGGAANSLGQLGSYSLLKADYPKALDYYLQALKINEEMLSEVKSSSEKQAVQKGIAKRLGNIGIIYRNQADYPHALEYYFKALKIFEDLGDKNKIATALGNIGIVYKEQVDYPKALDYYFRALKMDEESGNKNGISIRLGNIGNVYKEQADNPKVHQEGRDDLQDMALNYYSKALNVFKELGNKKGIAASLGSMGLVYKERGDYSKAISNYLMALKIDEELGDKNGIAAWLANIGSLYIKTGKYKEAEQYLQKATAINERIGAVNELGQCEELLSELYETTGKYGLALTHYKNAMSLKDTIFSEEKNKEITRKEMNYEFEKKEAAAKAEQDKQAAVEEADKRKQQAILYSVVTGLVVVVLFSGFVFRSLRITRKQKQLIEQQKHLVEEKQKEILDSIHYARRIQTALLPTDKYIEKTLVRLQKQN